MRVDKTRGRGREEEGEGGRVESKKEERKENAAKDLERVKEERGDGCEEEGMRRSAIMLTEGSAVGECASAHVRERVRVSVCIGECVYVTVRGNECSSSSSGGGGGGERNRR